MWWEEAAVGMVGRGSHRMARIQTSNSTCYVSHQDHHQFQSERDTTDQSSSDVIARLKRPRI